MDTLLRVVGFSLLVGVSSALFCAQCTYKAGPDVMPEVMGVHWLPGDSPNDNPACKSGDGELNVFQCSSKDHVACYVRFYTYSNTTYYQRGCTSYCHTIPEVTIAPRVEMTQLCCDEGNRCNHPENDISLLRAARNSGEQSEKEKAKQRGEYKPETPAENNEIPLL